MFESSSVLIVSCVVHLSRLTHELHICQRHYTMMKVFFKVPKYQVSAMKRGLPKKKAMNHGEDAEHSLMKVTFH